jgi:peptide/nickel transport system ATP-binding protein
MPNASQPVLELNHVYVTYESPFGSVAAVRDVNLKVDRDSIVGLVGESGCGKSTLGYAIMNLLKGNSRVSGSIYVNGQDVYALTRKELRKFRWNEMAMVFQSAMAALNPVMTVEEQIMDVFRSHRPEMSKMEARKRAKELLELVRIDSRHLRSYPHELSGGMKQRIVIAIAIALEPSLVIMDEPTTALDVVVQRSILDQIREIQREKHFAILFISHDFSLVSELASRVAVMYAGRIVELTESSSLNFPDGHHPYTQGLIRAIPKLTGEEVTIDGIPGNPPDLINLPQGCSFYPRCPFTVSKCKTEHPERHVVNKSEIECHLFAGEMERRGIHV